MGWEIPFVRRREPEYPASHASVDRLFGPEPTTGEHIGVPDPVRQSDFDGANGHPVAQLFSTFAPFFAFGTALGPESFGGRPFQTDPSAAYPYGELGVDPPRRVLIRPDSR